MHRQPGYGIVYNEQSTKPMPEGFPPGGRCVRTRLNRVLENAWTHAKDKCMTWLDVSNAFGTIPHLALETAIERSGAGETFLQAVRGVYTGATSTVSVAGGVTNEIEILSGI